MKELVENAVDAGATIIDVHLKEYGSEILEVSDNGTGVQKENFQNLTLKHYTSKLQNFEDLENVTTLGFRGEALSSLCALSNLSITTKYTNSEIATKIIYDNNGKIISETPIARAQGTTITLENLFSSLPVRRKEFIKNLKREFNKMCSLLYSYCLVCKGIRFKCININKNGNKSVIVATEGSSSVNENVISVFGTKQIASLVEIPLSIPDEQTLQEFGLNISDGNELPFSFECLTSSAQHGSGRSSTDRQFFYINSRPCEPTKLAKIVNETYKQFNVNQYPFVYLNVMTKGILIDVNVTPDKRQVFLEQEKLLFAVIKYSLLEVLKFFPSTFKMQNLNITKNCASPKNQGQGIKRRLSDSVLKKGSILEAFKKRTKTEISCQDSTNTLESKNFNINEDKTLPAKLIKNDILNDNTLQSKVKKYINSKNSDLLACQTYDILESNNVSIPKLLDVNKKYNSKDDLDKSSDKEGLEESKWINNINCFLNQSKDASVNDNDDLSMEIKIDCPAPKNNKKTICLNFSIRNIKYRIKQMQEKNETSKDIKVKFRSDVIPEDNTKAEDELNKHIKKEDFMKMKIIGQFNLGFIISLLDNDLFIIDQHATDEKYNFEQLISTSVIRNQKLIRPKPLQLTAGKEALLIENEEVFRKNGFIFVIDKNAPATKKIHLEAIPVSKETKFDEGDISEMLFVLQHSNLQTCQPTKVKQMFASRACRKSVMIGTPLLPSVMKKIVDHMGDIHQPWNCPHGRPTMRHLINLDLIHKLN